MPDLPEPLDDLDALNPVDDSEVEYYAETGKYPPRIMDIVYRAQLRSIDDITAMLGICVLGLFDAAYTQAGVKVMDRAIQLAAGEDKEEWWAHTMRRTRRTRRELFSLYEHPERFDQHVVTIGTRTDKLTLKVADLIESANHLVFTPKRLAAVRAHQEEMRRQREERNTRRATERIERMKAAQERERQLAAVRRAADKPEHEDHPLCFKCNKRRAVSAGLCDPCARWAETAEAAKRV